MKIYTEKERFFHELLITLHTYRWTGNEKKVIKILDMIGDYSYAHTNSNEGDEEDKCEKAYEELVKQYNAILKSKTRV